MLEENTLKVHNIIMENRKSISISGVQEVESFDENSIILVTDFGILTVLGENLHINKLNTDSGDVIIEGVVGALMYEDNVPKQKGFLNKVFK